MSAFRDSVSDAGTPGATMPLPRAALGSSLAGGARRINDSAKHLQPRRLGMFSGIGAVVFVLGTGLQWVLIALGNGKTSSYIWQAAFSVELSFLLNWRLTWRDRHIDLAGALVKWNAQKIALSVPNVVAY